MQYLDELDLFFITFLVICGGAVIYTVGVWMRSVARWEEVSEEMLKLQRETNDLLRQLVDRSDASGRS